MAQYLQAFGFSLVFAALASAAALLLSLLWVVLRSSSADAFLQTGGWAKFRALPDLLASVCESVPLLILLILLGQTGMRPEDPNPFMEYMQRALMLGLFMFPSIWRYLDSRLDLAREEVYPQQLMLWKVSSLKVGLNYVLWQNNKRGLFSSLIWVFTTAFALDLSIGLLANFGLGESFINWYDDSLGSLLGHNIDDSGLGSSILPLLFAFAVIILLYVWTQKLLPHPLPVYNRTREKHEAVQAPLYSFRELRLTPQHMDIGIPTALDLDEGGFVWLNGPSGSGKSLFIKAIMNLLRDEGEEDSILPVTPLIHYKDSALSEASVIMPQEPDLYIFPYLSVRDYLACMMDLDVDGLAARIRSAYQGENKDNFLDLLGVVSSIQETQVRNLSAGEKRMVAFVVAIAQSLQPDKKLVIFDEPDSSLDVNAVNALKFYLGSVNRKSVIYITHNVMHSRDIHAVVSQLNIWQLTPRTDNPVKQSILNVEDVEGHYEQVHAKVNSTLERVRELFSDSSVPTSAGSPLLRINFPLTIRLGRGLRLKASLNGRPQISLTVRASDGLIGIVGDNGIGKSSFLRALIGLHPTQDASLALGDGGFLVSQSTTAAIHRHGICYVYDDIEKALPGNLPLIEVIRDLNKVYGKGLHNTQYIVNFDNEMLSRPLTRFSGGERQKIVFDLVCHVIDARLLLLDEPFSRLDWGENLIQVSQWLRHKASLCPVVIISHNREILEAMAPENTWLLEAN